MKNLKRYFIGLCLVMALGVMVGCSSNDGYIATEDYTPKNVKEFDEEYDEKHQQKDVTQEYERKNIGIDKKNVQE